MLVGLLADFVGDHRAVDAAVVGDLADRRLERRAARCRRRSSRRPWPTADLLDRLAAAQQGHAAAGEDAFFDRRAGGVQGVFDAGLGLLHVGFGAAPTEMIATPPVSLASRSWNFSWSYSLSVSSIWLRSCSIAGLDLVRLAGALDDRGVVLVDLDLLGPAELLELEVLELEAQVFADHRAAGEDGHVAEHRLAAIAEAGGLDGADVEHAAELVDDQGGQRFALDVLGDDQQRLARLATFSSSGISSRRLLIFFSWIRIKASSSTHSISAGLLTKYGRE